MKNRHPSFVRLLTLAAALFTLNLSAADSPREHLSLDANWKFHLGDDWPDALHLSKAARNSGPAAARFNDTAWQSVNLPHDWAIELPFDPDANMSHGYKPVGPNFLETSVGWYRRTFDLPAADADKRIWLQFDGAFRDTTVYVNGWLVGHNESGYYPFRYDITDIVHCGNNNTVAVRVDASRFEGWWYEGAGIYRHVWLDKTAPVAIAPDGIFVYSKFPNNVPEGPAQIHVEADLLNTLMDKADAKVHCEILSPDGKSVAHFDGTGTVPEQSRQVVKLAASVDSPALWSPESPQLYKLVTTVEVGGKIVDRKDTEFGIRTLAFDANKGFLLNGSHYEIYGACNHQDMAGVGEALPDALQYFRIKKLKEFGWNAYRTAHNPATPELLDACDHLGMLVMDESRTLGSDEENLRRWETQVRRDRNHASVFLWSLCNEEPMQTDPNGGKVGATMQALVKKLDPTRAVTAAENVGDVFTGLQGTLEVRGWNYNINPDRAPQVEAYHAKHPNQPNIGSEMGSNLGTRGIYATDPKRGYISCRLGGVVKWWPFFADRPWLSGAFDWTGFDYRGEPSPYHWPSISANYGVLDTCGFPKDNAYYFKAWWTTNTVLHLLPHWNWPGMEGKEIEVDAYSNCKEVELFLNGESLGRQTMAPNSELIWKVKYEPGTLSAKGFAAAGKVIAETKEETTGEPSAVNLAPDRSVINADGEDLSMFTVSVMDAQGRVVPTAGNKINFELVGTGKIIGVGNGDPSCHEPDTFVGQPPVKIIPITGWRWKPATIPAKGALAPEYANDFDDSNWNSFDMTSNQELPVGQSAIYRAHVNLTMADLDNPGLQVRFAGMGDYGSVFVNNRLAGKADDWSAQPPFDIKKNLRAGDNVIAVGLIKESLRGGLNPDVKLEIISAPVIGAWSRSVFNGLAQVIVQSTKDAGEIKLTASADGLKSATVSVQTQPCMPRPSVP